MIKYLLLIFLASCAVVGPDIQERRYCKRRSSSAICPGTEHQETAMEWLLPRIRRD